MKTTSNNILVIGASGKSGARVYQKLSELGVSVLGASRQGEVHFDWRKPESWSAALLGIERVYLTYYPDLAMPEAPQDISTFCALAKIKGVKHITLLSGRGEPAAQVCEDIVKTSGLSWTIVRASWFNQNFSEGMFVNFIQAGVIALPVETVAEPFIDVDDICDVVVASLLDEKHSKKLYEVTGPELLTFAQLAKIFTQELEREVRFEPLSLDAFVNLMRENNVEEPVIEALTYLFTEVLDGRNEYVVNGVEQALGRKAKRFRDFVNHNAKRF